MTHPNPRSGARAFTLVELLVVIAIVGVLIAILLPVMSSVRRAGMTAKCVGNQRQVTAAYLSYLNDHNQMLWYRQASGVWSGGSGALFGAQNAPSQPGYLCYLLQSYGLQMAVFNGYKPIPNRYQTVWYCPTTTGQSSISGHGSTYFYQFLGQYIGNTSGPVSTLAVSDYITKKPYLQDYYGNHVAPSQLYNSNVINVYSYLDGHTAVGPYPPN